MFLGVCLRVCVYLTPLPHLATTHSFSVYFFYFHRLHRSVAMATMAPSFLFLLCWLLQTACSAFPEEPGPLNFIPTEGTLTSWLSRHLLPCMPLSEVTMCEVRGRTLTCRVLKWGWEWRGLRVMVWVVEVRQALTRRVLTSVQFRRCGVTLRNENRV